LIDTVSVPFERATAMPPGVYTSETFLQREQQCAEASKKRSNQIA